MVKAMKEAPLPRIRCHFMPSADVFLIAAPTRWYVTLLPNSSAKSPVFQLQSVLGAPAAENKLSVHLGNW